MPEPLIKNTPLIVSISIAALVIATMIGIFLWAESQPDVLVGF